MNYAFWLESLKKNTFLGESGVDQLIEIIKVLGTPNNEQIADMNPQLFSSFKTSKSFFVKNIAKN